MELERLLWEYEIRGSWWVNVFTVNVLQEYFGWYFQRRIRRRVTRMQRSIIEFDRIVRTLKGKHYLGF